MKMVMNGEGMMKANLMKAHLQVAEIYAELSYAKRLKVGSIIVKNERIISIGYNGTPAGWDNNCEDEIALAQKEISPGVYDLVYRYELKTKPEVIHAEANAIAKLARSSESGEGAEMFITHAPCMECAKLIYTSGISHVFYRNTYRDNSGVEFLQKCKVEVNQI
jgi:dCMP deaminase